MKLKLLSAIILFILISCGKPVNQKKDTVTSKDSTEKVNKNIYEYEWYKKIEDYNTKNISVTGYILFDTITNTFSDQNYTIYERPNCYDCGTITGSPVSDLQITDIDDSTFSGTNGTKKQWRLIRAQGLVVDYRHLRIEKIERAEYSYPTDEYYNSFTPISEELFSEPKGYKTLVRGEGYILVNLMTFGGDYIGFDFKNSAAKNVAVYIKVGNSANEVQALKDGYTQSDLKVRDKNANLIRGKKVRIYGTWSDFIDPNDPDKESACIIHVEIIEIIK